MYSHCLLYIDYYINRLEYEVKILSLSLPMHDATLSWCQSHSKIFSNPKTLNLIPPPSPPSPSPYLISKTSHHWTLPPSLPPPSLYHASSSQPLSSPDDDNNTAALTTASTSLPRPYPSILLP